MMLSGRAAEKIVFNDINTGASNDLERATQTARKMVMQYGMSDKLGYVTFNAEDHEVFLGRDFSQGRNYSEKIAAIIDEEIKRIVDECYAECEKLLTDNREKLDNVANALVEYEKLDAKEFEEVFVTGVFPGKETENVDEVVSNETVTE